MKECIGVDCEYFDCTSYTSMNIDTMTNRSIPYCKQQRKQLKVDYENRKVYVDECNPVINVINFTDGSYGVRTGMKYR